jgi:hypothetical protein
MSPTTSAAFVRRSGKVDNVNDRVVLMMMMIGTTTVREASLGEVHRRKV